MQKSTDLKLRELQKQLQQSNKNLIAQRKKSKEQQTLILQLKKNQTLLQDKFKKLEDQKLQQTKDQNTQKTKASTQIEEIEKQSLSNKDFLHQLQTEQNLLQDQLKKTDQKTKLPIQTVQLQN
jgi:hypothetical protein